MLVFSTHAFTEGDVAVGVGVGMAAISTHAFTEGDTFFFTPYPPTFYFNSRLHGRRHRILFFREFSDTISTHAFTEGDRIGDPTIQHSKKFQLTPSRKATITWRLPAISLQNFNSRLHGRRLQIQIIFAAKHFLFLLILSKFLILAFLFHLASLRFSLHPVIFPVRISLYFSVYLPFALETCTLYHNI